MFRLALIQMHVEGGAREKNLARAERFIAAAASTKAQVALLPETLDLGWTHGSANAAAGEIPGGESCERLRSAAQRHGLYVCAGLVERAGGQRFNSAVLFGPQGELLLHHRKINELDIAHHLYGPGDRLAVARTPLGTLGLMICADAFAPGQTVTRTLGLMGAEVILSPCAWAVPADYGDGGETYSQIWRKDYGPVARDFRLWIAGCSNVGGITDGPWAGRKCIGCSLVVGPDGKPVVRGPYGVEAETMIIVEVGSAAAPAENFQAQGRGGTASGNSAGLGKSS